jgi:hypothetical protein
MDITSGKRVEGRYASGKYFDSIEEAKADADGRKKVLQSWLTGDAYGDAYKDLNIDVDISAVDVN